MLCIVIPVYNHAEALGECLSSLCAQTVRPDRVVIVDDGSVDNPEPIARAWENKLPIIFVRQENRGAAAARNRGFAVIARSVPDATKQSRDGEDFIIFLDADITMRPDCLEKMQRALDENTEASYAYCSFKFGFKTFACGPFDPERLLQMPYIMTSSLIRVKNFPGFDESLKKFQDWDLWLTMLEHGKTGVWIPEILLYAEPRKSGMSSWLPSFVHKIPWPLFGWMPREVRRYREAKRIIKEKHSL